MVSPALVERLLAAVYALEPHVKVAAAVTGGGVSVAESLFRAGSSSSMLHFAVPYSRASLESYLHDPTSSSPRPASELKFCSADTSRRMAHAAWRQAQTLTRQEAEKDALQAANALPNVLERFRASLGIACTAALATNRPKKGPHECFLSVCRVRAATRDNVLLRPQCETYHLQLDKALGRSRAEEDHIVGHWLVYLLAKAAEADPEACSAFHDALVAEQSGEDAITAVDQAESKSGGPDVDPLHDIFNSKEDQLVGVGFFPESSADGGSVASRVATRGLDFRGLVLPGSFNPLHQGHVELALAAQRLLESRTGIQLPVAFELAVANADKGSLERSTIAARVAQFAGDSALALGAWPVVVTTATLFGQKAELLPGCVFVIGADTAVRIVDQKYYDMDEHKMVLALDAFARRGCSFVVAGRFDSKAENRFVSAEEVLEHHVPPALRHLFVPLTEKDYRDDLSSTQIRNQRAKESE